MQSSIINVVDNYKELSLAEKSALILIGNANKSLNASKLARYLGVEAPTASKILEKLNLYGLIFKDRKGKELQLELSSTGRELVNRLKGNEKGRALVMFL